jgi:ABC-type multidrug transport system fused ATPase/permease subunit
MGVLPYIFITGGFQEATLQRAVKEDEAAYLKSGADAEEALNAIKIVKAYGQETEELRKFQNHLDASDKITSSYAWYYGFAFGFIETITYFQCAFFVLIGGFFITEQVISS